MYKTQAFSQHPKMKSISFVTLSLAAIANAVATDYELTELTKRAAPQGIDVSSYQPSINWATVKANGVAFAYIKATEGTGTCYTHTGILYVER